MVRQLFQSYNRTEKSERSKGFEKIHMRNLLFELLLNLTMMIIAGKRFSGDMAAENVEEMKHYKKAVEDLLVLSAAGNIEDFFPILRILDLKGKMKRMRQAADVNEMMAQKLINEHRQEGGENRKTMIARMLQLSKEDPEKYSDLVIQNICISLLLGGTETSATTLQWAMAKKATSEIEAHVGNERLIEESDIANLPYLQNIINETLRMYPTAPLLMPHVSSKEVTVSGYVIPTGTMLLVNLYHIQQSPEIWDEPAMFKPERFEKRNTDATWMMPFGMGRRSATMHEMVLVLGTLIQCFDWETVGGKPVDMTEGLGLTLPMAVPLEALYRSRQVMVKVLTEL